MNAARSVGVLRPSAAHRAALVTVWALALLIGWPASVPWLEMAAGSSPDARTVTVDGAGWIRSAEAQNRRRRRRPARRDRRRPAAPARDNDSRPAPGDGSPGPSAPSEPAASKDPNKVFDFTGLDISGQLRTPQLLYFLDRAAEELDRASLERRSFIPEMVQSIDEESL